MSSGNGTLVVEQVSSVAHRAGEEGELFVNALLCLRDNLLGKV
jgi:hypothetical protein